MFAVSQFGIDVAAMEEYGILDDGQPESRSADLSAAPLVHTVEPFEKPSQMLGSHSYSIITDTEIVGLIVGRKAGNPDGRTLSGISQSIVDRCKAFVHMELG